MTDNLADFYWRQAFAEASHIIDDKGDYLNGKGGAIVYWMQQAGMTAHQARSMIQDIKQRSRGSPFPYARACIRNWKAEQEAAQ